MFVETNGTMEAARWVSWLRLLWNLAVHWSKFRKGATFDTPYSSIMSHSAM